MNILVVDDDVELTGAMTRMLESSGHAVMTAGTAEDAVKLVQQGEYDFVLVDYKMPQNNGTWFMENANIPSRTKVLLMTAYVTKEIVQEMFSLGAVGYLAKPFDKKELLRHLKFHSSRNNPDSSAT